VRKNSSLHKGLRGGFLIFLFASNLLRAQTDISPVVSRLNTSTVTVTTYDADGSYISTGCGFFASKQGDVITCRHVIEGASQVSIQIEGGRAYKVPDVIAEDKEGDLIRLRADVPEEVIQILTTTPTAAREGERIYVVGPETDNPGSREYLEGKIAGIRDIYGFGTIIEITAPLTPGFSGSPVVNLKGDIVGVATFQVIGEEYVNFAVPADRVLRLIPRDAEPVAGWESRRKHEISEIEEELYLTGVGLMWAEEWESALYCLKGVVEEDPLYVIAYPLIGYCSLQLGHWEDAVDAYRQTLLIKPDDATAYSHLGLAYCKLERWGLAVAAFKQAARLEPEDPQNHIELGVAFSKVGDWPAALESFNKAVEIDPSSDEAHFGLGFCYWILEEDAKAWSQYRILESLGSSLATDLHDYLSK